jgi:membrane associated rhomboid family serine protease
MIPIRDTAPCYHRPIMTWSIIVVCTLIFIVMAFLPNQISYWAINHFGMIAIRYSNPQWAHVFGLPMDYGFSFISNLFFHDDWLHLLTNMWFLWIFGDNVEDRMGRFPFLVFYLLCGASATFLQWYFGRSQIIPVIGASGAIAGILAAYYFLYPLERVIVWIPFIYPILLPIPAIAFLGLWVMLQLHNATEIAFFTHQSANVAWWAHLGGFLAGGFLYRFFSKKLPLELEP